MQKGNRNSVVTWLQPSVPDETGLPLNVLERLRLQNQWKKLCTVLTNLFLHRLLMFCLFKHKFTHILEDLPWTEVYKVKDEIIIVMRNALRQIKKKYI